MAQKLLVTVSKDRKVISVARGRALHSFSEPRSRQSTVKRTDELFVCTLSSSKTTNNQMKKVMTHNSSVLQDELSNGRQIKCTQFVKTENSSVV